MNTTTNKQDETLDPLELLVNELRQSNVRQYTCVNDSGYSQLERNIVTILTTWQKEQDKVIIDKLIEALEMELWYEENGEAESQRHGRPRYITRLEIMRELLQSLK